MFIYIYIYIKFTFALYNFIVILIHIYIYIYTFVLIILGPVPRGADVRRGLPLDAPQPPREAATSRREAATSGAAAAGAAQDVARPRRVATARLRRTAGRLLRLGRGRAQEQPRPRRRVGLRLCPGHLRRGLAPPVVAAPPGVGAGERLAALAAAGRGPRPGQGVLGAVVAAAPSAELAPRLRPPAGRRAGRARLRRRRPGLLGPRRAPLRGSK